MEVSCCHVNNIETKIAVNSSLINRVITIRITGRCHAGVLAVSVLLSQSIFCL
jgi:hypothetical protein